MHRRALGNAVGAYLMTITAEQWRWIREDRPDLVRELLGFLEDGSRGHH